MKSYLNRNFLLLILLVVMSVSLSFGQDQDKPESNSKIKMFVEYKLLQDNLLTDDNIKVDVNDDKIILSGTVPSLYDKKVVEDEAHSVDENYIIINNLKLDKSEIPDTELEKTILSKIQSNLFYTIFDWLTVKSDDGLVTLKGWVHLPWLKNQFQTEIEKIPGVTSVQNKLQYTFGPGDLGITAARLIYNHPMFQGLQYSSNPPIHIIVNNGSVILEGFVKSENAKSLAEHLVRYRTDALSLEDNLKIKM